MVDIHSHILPEVDDGSKSWETSVAMCRMAAADGITHQVATPHANDRYHYDRTYLQGLVAHLQGLMGDALKLTLSAPPLEGQANIALAEYFSEIFSVPRGAFQVVTGIRSRNKVIRINGRTAAELQRMLREHFTV